MSGQYASKLPLYSITSQGTLYIQHSRSPRTTSSQVFRGLPVPYPSATISLHFFTQQSLSIVLTCPNHLSLCMQCLMLTPGDPSTRQKTFHPSLSHYTSTIPSCHLSPALRSPLLSLPRSHYHREQHSWQAWKRLPFVRSEETSEVCK